MRLVILSVFFSTIVFMTSCADAATFSVRLNINNTDNMVYIPGVGETGSDNLGSDTIYTNPPHFYIASYLNNILTGLVAARGSALVVNTGILNHSIEIRQDIKNSRVFLTFTKGGWQIIDKNINLIEAGEFLSCITPSFAFGLGNFYPIKLLLSYMDIDITGDMVLQRGEHRLIIENTGTSGNRPVVNIR